MKNKAAKNIYLQKKFKAVFSALCIICLIFSFLLFGSTEISAEQGSAVTSVNAPLLDCKSAILIEETTGAVLYEKNADEALPPASVTKVMTLLLVMEAIEEGKISLSDKVRASAHASAMGGSQIFLKEGEEMSCEDLLKSVVIASANDAAVALAEHSYGSEEAFVARMNERAAELGMKNTVFENTNGLDDTTSSHLTTARDIALMSRALSAYPKIFEYSGRWTDALRNGSFGLTNTNRLIRFYKGATGLKTGSTSKAGFCISATAKRDGLSLICVIMGAQSSSIRNACASKLLDYGFANFALFKADKAAIGGVPVLYGTAPAVSGETQGFGAVVDKEKLSRVQGKILIGESISAPINKGDLLGSVSYSIDGEEIGRSNIFALEAVPKMNFWRMMWAYVCKIAEIM